LPQPLPRKYLKVLLSPGPCIHYIWSPPVHRT
ncbi:unnamed protein product, partial [Staurois parvus]